MTEKKEKKISVPLDGVVRIPKSIDRLIDLEASDKQSFKYEIVIQMFEAYQREKLRDSHKELEVKPASDSDRKIPQDLSTISDPVRSGVVVQSGPGFQGPASPLEAASIERLLKCLRSTHPSLSTATVSMLAMLEELAALYERQSGSIPATPTESVPQRDASVSEASIAIRRASDRVADSAKRTLERIRTARSDGSRSEKGSTRDAPAPRKRGNG